MDNSLLNKLRKTMAGLTTVAVLASFLSFAGVAAASSFDDTVGHWGEDYIETLAGMGVVSGYGDGNFRPDQGVTRAELVKIVMEGFDMPRPGAANSFSDVPASHWAVDYIADATALGLVSGDDGASTFRPDAVVNRAEAVKIIMGAAGLDTQDSEERAAALFVDVRSSDWFATYVGKAVMNGTINGEEPYELDSDNRVDSEGTFNPAGLMTRAAVSKVVTLSLDPTEQDIDFSEIVSGGEGDLMIELSDMSPSPDTVPSGATAVTMGVWDFTAGGDDVFLDSLTFHQYGVTSLPSGHSVYLYKYEDGQWMRMTSGASVNGTTHNVTFQVDETIEEGDTHMYAVRLDVGTVSATSEAGFELESAESVNSDAEDLDADFPIEAGKFSLSTTAAGTITISKNGNPANAQVGQDGATIAKFTMSAATESAELQELGLYLSGSVNTSDVEGFELYSTSDDSEPIATVDSVDSNDVIRFTIDDYVIGKGSTKSFYVTADFNTGRTADTVKVYVDENTDVVAEGSLYGYGMGVTRASYNGDADSCASASSVDCNYMSLEGGDITVTTDGPTSTSARINADDFTLMNFDIVSVTDVTFRSFPISLTLSETSSAGGLLNGTAANLSDIKVINRDTGEEIFSAVDSDVFVTAQGGSTAIDDTATDNDGSEAFHLFTDTLDMSAGEELSLALVVDIENNSSLDGETIDSTLDFGSSTSYPEIRDANNKVLTNSSVLVPSSDVSGKQMTIENSSLTFALASTVNSDTYVKGSDDVRFACFSVSTGEASDIEIDDLTLTVSFDENIDGTYGTSGSDNSTNANVVVGSVWLEDGNGEVIAPAESVTTSGTVLFTDMNYDVDAGGTEIACVVGDISNNAYVNSTNDRIAFGINAATDVVALDQDGNTLASSQISGASSLNVSTTGPTVVMTVSGGGTLTASVDSATPKEDIIVAGSSDVEMARIKFAATDEDFTVEKLAIFNRYDSTAHDANDVVGTYDDNITSITLEYEDADGVTQTATSYLTKSNATFSGLEIHVPKDDDAVVTVYADLNSIANGADAADYPEFNLAFNNFEANAQGSGETYTAKKMDDTDADGTITDEELLINNSSSDTFDDADFVATVTYTNDASDLVGTTTLGASASFTIDNNGADQVDLPVGAFICMTDAGGDTACNSDTDDIYVVTSWTDGSTEDTVVATLINDGGDGTYNAADEILYALPNDDYMTSVKMMHVYESKPTLTLSASSPSGTVSVDSEDEILIFNATANAQEDVTVRLAKELTTCLEGNSTLTVENAADTTAAEQVDGSGCNVDAIAGADDFVAYSAAGLENYSYASFWIRWVDSQAADSATLIPGEIELNCNVDNSSAPDGTPRAVTASNIVGSPSALLEGAWYHVTDVAMPDDCGASHEFINIVFSGADDAGPDHADDDVFLDRVVLYNDKMTFDLTSDSDFEQDLDGDGNHEDQVPVAAYLREGGSTIATGYIDVAGDSAAGTDQSTAIVHFYPIDGTDAEIEISAGSSDGKTFTLVTNTEDLISEDSGVEDPVSIKMDLGTASNGTVTAGDFWWYESNASVQWIGQVTSTQLSGNSLKY